MNQAIQTDKPFRSSEHLAWIDLEMTGLDVETQVILQAAVIITDKQLTPLAELALDVWQPESALVNMTPFVRSMHERTGLLKRLKKSDVDLAEAEKQLLRVVSDWCECGAVLCGNSIGQDRKFIDKYMPGLGRYLGYRMVDVSSLKVLAGLWYGQESVFRKKKEGAHDALVDIKASIAELSHYREQLLK